VGPVTPTDFGLSCIAGAPAGRAMSAASNAAAGLAGNPCASASPVTAAMSVSTQVSQFLQGVGGNLEDDPVLKALLTLLVLMALLQQQATRNDAMQQLSSAVGRSMNASAGSSGAWAASMEIYHSTTLILSSNADVSNSNSNDPAASNPNLHVDVLI